MSSWKCRFITYLLLRLSNPWGKGEHRIPFTAICNFWSSFILASSHDLQSQLERHKWTVEALWEQHEIERLHRKKYKKRMFPHLLADREGRLFIEATSAIEKYSENRSYWKKLCERTDLRTNLSILIEDKREFPIRNNRFNNPGISIRWQSIQGFLIQ